MKNLGASMVRFSWAASLYGVQSMASWLLPEAASQSHEPSSIPPSPAWSCRSPLGEPERMVLQAADELQAELRPRFRRRLDPRTWTPASFLEEGGELLQLSQRFFRTLAPGGDGLAVRLEWRNRLRVYRWVRKARDLALPRLTSPGEGGDFDLAQALEAESRNPRPGSLWIAEGLAHDAVAGLDAPDATNLAPILRTVPDRFRLPVHVGAGLALAERALSPLSPRSSPPDLRGVLDNLETLAEAAAPGFRAALLESLGLVTRCFYPPMVTPLDRQLIGRPGDLRSLFWHGAGRAVYFLPLQLLPGVGTIQRALDRCRQESPDEESRRAAQGGLAWAFAAVNCHTPVVLDYFLGASGKPSEDGSFETAFGEAMIFLHRSAPEVSPIPGLLAHRPQVAPEVRWKRLVIEPLAKLTPGRPAATTTSNGESGIEGYARSIARGGLP